MNIGCICSSNIYDVREKSLKRVLLNLSIMRSIPLRLWLLAIASALLQAMLFAIAGPVPMWRRALCWFAVAPLIVALLAKDRGGNSLRPGQTAMLGYVCGVLWY